MDEKRRKSFVNKMKKLIEKEQQNKHFISRLFCFIHVFPENDLPIPTQGISTKNLAKPSPTFTRRLRNVSDIDQFWKLEFIGVKEEPKTVDDDKAFSQFKKSISKHNGRYEVTYSKITRRTKVTSKLRQQYLKTISSGIRRFGPFEKMTKREPSTLPDLCEVWKQLQTKTSSLRNWDSV
ncbi:unnamed protein product [Brugia pahangi]|uniref:DUF4806 domain-containing protein n=1 Tax=Brugia pahangi TaxID=6280 RepID=A0A0N4T4W6_BRUPA|nr:unnamed protein product [Brugia pahangi]